MPIFKITPDRNRPDGWNLFSPFGIPVYIEPSFLFLIVLVFLMNARGSGGINIPQVGLYCVIIFVSLLVHELGHALTARAVGCDSIRIALAMFGGYATHSPTTRGRSLLVILAGPAFGLVLGLLALMASTSSRIVNFGPEEAMPFVLYWLIRMNIFWTFFNLIPMHPLDGGQAFFHFLTYWIAPNRAMLFVSRLSMGLAVLVGILGYKMGLIFVPYFCLTFFMTNMQIAQALRGS